MAEQSGQAMKAGQTRRGTCNNCSVEFDITYEPKATTPKLAKGIRPVELSGRCPFCGQDEVDFE